MPDTTPFRSVFDHAPIGMALLDAEGGLLRTNHAFAEMAGVPADELRGTHLLDRFAPSDRDRVAELLQISAEGGAWAPLEASLLRADGEERRAQLTALSWPAQGSSGPWRLVQAQDVTEQRRLQHDRDRIAEELERSNAELERFAYVASHDLQEPLRMVSSFAQLLARRYRGRLDAEADEYIGFLVDGATRMKELIDALLDYSRVGRKAPALRRLELDAVLDLAVENLGPAIAQAGGSIERGELRAVIGDEGLLVRVLQNLIGNALKFHPPDRPPRVRVDAERRGAQVIVRVRDEGIGIARDQLGRIFEPFRRLHAASTYGGSGMGLSIAARIVERHGGRLWAESTPDEGSTFFFSLAAAPADMDEQP